jgi:hypothetical protein
MTSEPLAPSIDLTTPPALDEARAGREELHRDMNQLEEAVAAPAAGRTDVWARQVHETLVRLGASFERHIAITERPDGLFDEILKAAPRLSGGLHKLADEHKAIRAAISRAIDAVRERTDAVPDDSPALEGRESVIEVLNQLMRHRQRGADLVYEAYQVDIGVGD